MSQRPIGQLPDKSLSVCNSAFAVIFVQLVHHDTQAADKVAGRDLKSMMSMSMSLPVLMIVFFCIRNLRCSIFGAPR